MRTHCLDVKDERDLRWAARLRARLLGDPVDILHAQSPYPAGIARLVVRSLPKRVRPRLVYTVHNTFPSFSTPTRILNGLTYPLDDADLAVSTEVHETIWPRLQARTEVVVHGVLLDEVRAQLVHRDEVRTELGIDASEKVVGTIANFRRQKDYPNLLAAARRLLDRGWDGRIVAVGQGPLEAEMRALHDRLGLGDRVLLLGQRADAVRVLAACDLFTMASDNEGPSRRAHGGPRARAPRRLHRGRRDPGGGDRRGRGPARATEGPGARWPTPSRPSPGTTSAGPRWPRPHERPASASTSGAR